MKKLIAIATLFSAGALFTDCQKKTDCAAEVICTDINDKPVVGAKVFLYADVKNENKSTVRADLTATGNTDSEGKVSFIFKLPAVYDVSVTAGAQGGKGLIKLEEGKRTEKIIIVK